MYQWSLVYHVRTNLFSDEHLWVSEANVLHSLSRFSTRGPHINIALHFACFTPYRKTIDPATETFWVDIEIVAILPLERDVDTFCFHRLVQTLELLELIYIDLGNIFPY